MLTLNLLCTSRVNPKLSAWAYIFGSYGFNAHPLAPPGLKVLIYKKSTVQKMWGYHGTNAWYIGPSKEHCRYLECYVPSSGAVVDTGT
eukprot:13712699-Ditylum_brightwellii.AAC.1